MSALGVLGTFPHSCCVMESGVSGCMGWGGGREQSCCGRVGDQAGPPQVLGPPRLRGPEQPYMW